ncbi:unnamed protein product [Lathyrus sativus]|nr:unnamed protein product [Lathyrus sativus]
MSQSTDEELMQNNEPFILNEEVSEYSEDELHEVHLEDLFGSSVDKHNEDLVTMPSQITYAQPINLYNPPVHMSNICLEASQPISIFVNYTPNHIGDNLEIGMRF